MRTIAHRRALAGSPSPAAWRSSISMFLRSFASFCSFQISKSLPTKLVDYCLPRLRGRSAIRNVANASAITAAFATQDYERLRGCFVDYLHQPFRKKLVPFLEDTIRSAERKGALGAFLSGSGSAICAITLRNPRKIAGAMMRASRQKDAGIIVTRADNQGVQILKSAIRNLKSKI